MCELQQQLSIWLTRCVLSVEIFSLSKQQNARQLKCVQDQRLLAGSNVASYNTSNRKRHLDKFHREDHRGLLLANSQNQQENVAAAIAQRYRYFLTVVVVAAAAALPDRHTGFVPPQMKLCCFQPI